MSDTEFCWWSIGQLAERIQTREVSPVEVTRAILDRAESLADHINAFTVLTRESALRDARRAEDEVAAGRWRGALHGVPVSLKDLFDVEGVPTTAASRWFPDEPCKRDSAAAGRLRAAGAVLIGKNNLHELAFGVTSDSSRFGPVRNPWDRSRTPGGSSGGSAAAVASGASYSSLGTDSGGSVRFPASICGVAGLKPSFGRVSRYGLLPLAPSLDHVGWFTRSVEDAALVLAALAGPDPRDPDCLEAEVPSFDPRCASDLAGVRLGILEGSFEFAQPEVAALARAALDVLRDAGAKTELVGIRNLGDIRNAAQITIFAEAAAVHRERLDERPEDLFPDIRERLERGRSLPATDYIRAQEVRREARAEVAGLFERIDALITPMAPFAAPPIGTPTVVVAGRELPFAAAAVSQTREWNLLGNPALSVPCGFTSESLPVAIQVVARPQAESDVLRVGVAYQRRTAFHQRHPDLHHLPQKQSAITQGPGKELIKGTF